LEDGWFIDARRKGNEARFINHSCDPNCVFQKVNVNGLPRIAVLCIKDIAAGEFLTCDYLDSTYNVQCRCGAAGCRGTMTVRKV
jgi:histone-lysine N-methyltransferase ASH1L